MAKRAGSSGFDATHSPLERAYIWGKEGVEVTTRQLQNWLDGHTLQNLEHRRDILKRRAATAHAVRVITASHADAKPRQRFTAKPTGSLGAPTFWTQLRAITNHDAGWRSCHCVHSED